MDIYGTADLEKSDRDSVTHSIVLSVLSNVLPSTERMADIAIRARRCLDIEQSSAFKTPQAH